MRDLSCKTWRLLVLLATCASRAAASCDSPDESAFYATSGGSAIYERPGMSALEILKERGFDAKDVYLNTKDGYKLHLVHATNPLIKKSSGVPILFVHGILGSANVFVINSLEAEPRDMSQWDLSDVDAIADDPSSKSLALLALNFGHEVWLLDRRGSPASQWRGKKTQSAANLNQMLAAITDYRAAKKKFPDSFGSFWNYSFDQQVEYDLPQAIEHVSKQSGGSRVALVGHSAGGSLILMTLSDKPKLADKVSSAILWSPGYSLGHSEGFKFLLPLRPFLEGYIGSIPPAFTVPAIQGLLGMLCGTSIAQKTICAPGFDAVLGDSGGWAPVTPRLISSMFFASSSHELAQNLQNVEFDGLMHKYDYGSKEANMKKHGRAEPPLYNLSRITLDRISFYASKTDLIITDEDVRFSASLLKVPHEYHFIDTTFNHQGYFFHDKTPRLAVIPSLQDIRRFSETEFEFELE